MKNTIINWSDSSDQVHINHLLGQNATEEFSCVNATKYEDVVNLLKSEQDVEMIVKHMIDYDIETFSNIQKIGKNFPGTPFVAVFNQEQETSTKESVKYLLRSIEKRKNRAEYLNNATDIEKKLEGMDQESEEYKEDALVGYHLTPRQREVLLLIAKGKSNKQIARMLQMSEGTVKIHCMAIFRELGVNNRTQAAMLAEDLFKAEH